MLGNYDQKWYFVLIPLYLMPIILMLVYNTLRVKFHKTVNCWFCNTNTKVPFKEQNSFVCPSCNQYNGFNEDGSYNKCIPEQHDEMLNEQHPSPKKGASAPKNGLCRICNNNQQLKVYQLANFVPMNEDNYDKEIEHFQAQLDKAYKLCPKCDTVLRKIISVQSRWMLGLKMAYWKKSGKSMQNFNESSHETTQKRNWWRLLVNSIAVLALIASFAYIYNDWNFINRLPNRLFDHLKTHLKSVSNFARIYTDNIPNCDFMRGFGVSFKEALILGAINIIAIYTLFVYGLFYKPKTQVFKKEINFKPIRSPKMKPDTTFFEHNSTDISNNAEESDYEDFKTFYSPKSRKTTLPKKTVPIFGDKTPFRSNLNESKSPIFTSNLNKSKSPIVFHNLNDSFHSVTSSVFYDAVPNDLNTNLGNLSITNKKPVLSPPKLKNPWRNNWDRDLFSRSSSQSSGIFSIDQHNSSPNSVCNESICSEPAKGFYPIKFSAFAQTKPSFSNFSDTRSIYSDRSLFNFDAVQSYKS